MYKLAIPTNVISLLAQHFPDMKVLELVGSGSTKTRQSRPFSFNYGTISSRTMNKFDLEKKYLGGDNCETMGEIYDNLVKKERFLDGTLSMLKTYVDLGKSFKSDYAELLFTKYTPHQRIDQPRIVDGGSFPDQDLYTALLSFRKKLPKEARMYFKSTVLNLTAVSPNPEWLADETFIDAVFEDPMMRLNTSTRQWMFKCFDMKKGGRPKGDTNG